MVLRAAYVGILILATLAPFQFQFDLHVALERLSRAFAPAYSPADFVDAVRNLALFGGWGALWVVTAAPGRAQRAWWPPLWTGLLLSVTIEFTQSFTPRRNPNILDVATNGLGSLGGALLILGLVTLVHSLRSEKSHVGIPGALLAGSYLMAVALEAVFAPFRLTPIAGIYGGPLSRFRGTLVHFEWASLSELPLGDILLFLPAGAFAVLALAEHGKSYRSAARLTIILGSLLWIVAELLHAPQALPVELGAIVVHAGSTSLGAWLAGRYLSRIGRALRGPLRPRYLLVLYALVLLIWAWRPGRAGSDTTDATDLSWRRLIPLQGSAPRMDLYSVADLGEGFLLFFPVGCILAVWPVRRRGLLASYLPGVIVAVAGELGQPLIAGRYFDVTDILVEVAGMGMGWAIMRRAGFTEYGEILATSPPRQAVG